jgi:hypothetical protein
MAAEARLLVVIAPDPVPRDDSKAPLADILDSCYISQEKTQPLVSF